MVARFRREGLHGIVWVILGISGVLQRRGEDLQPQVFLVTYAISSSLDDADLVVQPLNEPERNLVLGLAVSSDSIPMAFDHCRELFIGLESLPLQCGAPVLEEAPRPPLALVVPELTEGFLEYIGGVEPLVGSEQPLEGLAAVQTQVLPMREQGVLLAFDETPVLAGQPGILAAAHFVQ